MSRDIVERWDARLRFVTRSDVRVGLGHETGEVDMGLATDGLGTWIVPGTSWAGVLRAWAKERFDPADVDRVFGAANRGAQARPPALSASGSTATTTRRQRHTPPEPGAASLLWCDDAEVAADAATVRWSVGIDRRTGTAAPEALYNQYTWPPGVYVDVPLRVEVLRGDDRGRVFLATLIRWLESHRLRVGAGTTRGMGVLELVHHRVTRLPLDDEAAPTALRRLIAGGTDHLEDATAELAQHARFPAEPDHLDITVAWTSAQPVFVRANDDYKVEVAPRTAPRSDGKLAQVLPATAIGGALRAHAERLVRTVRPGPAPTVGPGVTPLHEQVDVPLVKELFGAARAPDTQETTTTRSRVQIEDTYGERELGEDALDQIRAGRPPGEGWALQHHNAIDRWTGGAANRRLFDALYPPVSKGAEGYGDLRLTIDTASLLRERSGWAALGLLFLVLCDLQQRRVPIGALTTRGAGDLQATSVTVSANSIGTDTFPAGPRDTGSEPPEGWSVEREVWERAILAWRDWARHADQEVQ